jgi:NitT/TauT family transport system substrate-binding protein
MSSRSRRLLATFGVVTLLLAACGSSSSPGQCAGGGAGAPSPACGSPSLTAPSQSASVTAAPSSAAPSGPATKLVVGLGYIPSIQFAPFYLAQTDGSYAAAGLDVEFQNKIDPDLITLVGQGSIDVGIADGTSVIPAVSQAIPVRYVATIYGKFPSIVFAKASSGIKTAADLKGKKLGIPGKYGSSWIMLQALLSSVGLTPDDLTIVEYPDFGQGAAVASGAVDAATGFDNNEPIQLQLSGVPTTVLTVDDFLALPGPGLISSVNTLAAKHDAIAAFVAVTLKAMQTIQATPSAGLGASIKVVPDLATAKDTQTAILAATIDAWSGRIQVAQGLGALDPESWTKSIGYMTDLKLVPNPITVDDVLQTGLLPTGG